MIVSIWVFFMVGDALEQTEHRTAYVQDFASPWEHDREPTVVEQRCEEEFHRRYPGYVVCDSGWCRQEVKVMGE